MPLAPSVIKPDVLGIFPKFNEPYEGRCNFLYLDVKRLVTTGVGNLVEPIALALSLPWLKADMSPASQRDIRAAWLKVKNDKTLDPLQGGYQYKKLTTLRLTEGSIDALILRRVEDMARTIQASHPKFASFPADAQLAVLSMAWAMGPSFHFPHFWACMEAGDYIGAAAECKISGTGTIVKRNLANKLLLVNAARTTDPEHLYWPKLVPPPSPTS